MPYTLVPYPSNSSVSTTTRMAQQEQLDHKSAYNDHDSNGLSRQVTVTMSPEHYERLFFSPNGPQRGDLQKRFANPTLLGLISFLIPYTSTIFILLGWGGATPPSSLIGLTGDYYFLGSIGMVIAGLAEFVLGNTFPFAVFIIFGIHWGSLVSVTYAPIRDVKRPEADFTARATRKTPSTKSPLHSTLLPAEQAREPSGPHTIPPKRGTTSRWPLSASSCSSAPSASTSRSCWCSSV